jgi:hypothetical protein
MTSKPQPKRLLMPNQQQVEAILNGQKTCHRIEVRPRFEWHMDEADDGRPWPYFDSYVFAEPDPIPVPSPLGMPGDQLWLAENHYRYTGCGPPPSSWKLCPGDPSPRLARGYMDDPDARAMADGGCCVLVSAVAMPRWASRILLEITDVAVQGVHEISRGEAMEEGCPFPNLAGEPDPRVWFWKGWDAIHNRRAAYRNPQAWVYSFKMLSPPPP